MENDNLGGIEGCMDRKSVSVSVDVKKMFKQRTASTKERSNVAVGWCSYFCSSAKGISHLPSTMEGEQHCCNVDVLVSVW